MSTCFSTFDLQKLEIFGQSFFLHSVLPAKTDTFALTFTLRKIRQSSRYVGIVAHRYINSVESLIEYRFISRNSYLHFSVYRAKFTVSISVALSFFFYLYLVLRGASKILLRSSQTLGSQQTTWVPFEENLTSQKVTVDHDESESGKE